MRRLQNLEKNVVKIQGNNWPIFGPFLHLQEFFKNRGLSFETSNSDFCDLLNELFHMDQKNLTKKILKSYLWSPI